MVSYSIKLDKFVYLSEPKNEKELEEKQYFVINLRAKFWLQVVRVLQFKRKEKKKRGRGGWEKASVSWIPDPSRRGSLQHPATSRVASGIKMQSSTNCRARDVLCRHLLCRVHCVHTCTTFSVQMRLFHVICVASQVVRHLNRRRTAGSFLSGSKCSLAQTL